MIGILFAVVFVWNVGIPYIGKYWFREVISSGGEADGFSYAVEAYRFQERIIGGKPDAGFKIRIGVHKWYDEADYQIDFANLSAKAVEFAHFKGDHLLLSVRYRIFEDSISGDGTYRLLFNKKSGTMRSCQASESAIPAEHDCVALTLAAKELFPDAFPDTPPTGR